mgnify:FL=1
MTNRERGLQIARNISRTLSTLTEGVIGNNAIRGNGIWATTKPSRAGLETKLKRLCKEHNIKTEEL